MKLDIQAATLFLIQATVLLGSPGPGIVALIGVGRQSGFVGGQPFFWGLQVGLALAAGFSAGGLFSLIATISFARLGLSVVAGAYLAWLAFKIAMAPVGSGLGQSTRDPPTTTGGLLLGISNPKSYFAFASLFGASSKMLSGEISDLCLKWLVCVSVMIAVDLAWLWIGAYARRLTVAPRVERLANIAMALVIVSTALVSLV